MKRRVGVALVGFALHAGTVALARALDALEFDATLTSWATLGAVALAVAAAASRAHRHDEGVPVALDAATVWFVLGLTHHYLVGFVPLWSGHEVSGAAHIAWDLTYHLPPTALAGAAVAGGSRPA